MVIVSVSKVCCCLLRPARSPTFMTFPGLLCEELHQKGWPVSRSSHPCVLTQKFPIKHSEREYDCSLPLSFTSRSSAFHIVTFRVLTTASMKTKAFKYTASCRLLEVHRRFRGLYCLHLLSPLRKEKVKKVKQSRYTPWRRLGREDV
jgi:hypothetical protein